MKATIKPLTDYQRVWILAKVNGGFYTDDDLPRTPIKWPTNGWLTKRREELAEKGEQ